MNPAAHQNLALDAELGVNSLILQYFRTIADPLPEVNPRPGCGFHPTKVNHSLYAPSGYNKRTGRVRSVRVENRHDA